MLKLNGNEYSVTDYAGMESSIALIDNYNGKPLTKISSNAFANCTSLISIEIPDSVTSIGDSAFYNCSSLTSIEIPNRVTLITMMVL